MRKTADLTEGQALFAREHSAHSPVAADAGMVLLYHHEADRTVRWLVDKRGEAVEQRAFPASIFTDHTGNG